MLNVKKAKKNYPLRTRTLVRGNLFYRERKSLRSRAQTFVVVKKNGSVAYGGADYPSW